jgi:hypothetical protein
MASVTSQRGRLYLLARVPHRDGRPGMAQTRIALRLDDTPVNRRTAAKLLKTLEQQLARGEFSWDYWSDRQQGITWREAITRLHRALVRRQRWIRHPLNPQLTLEALWCDYLQGLCAS